MQIGGGFAYLKSEVDEELRFHQQLTASHGILQSRTRLEQRFFDNADEPIWRLRERIQATVPLDAAPGNPNSVILIYSRRSEAISNFGTTSGWNREQLWCNSYGIDMRGPAYSDLHSLRPADASCSTCASRHFATTNPTPSTMCPGFRSTGGSDQATICVRRASG